MIFSMRGGAIALTLVRLAGSDGVDRGAHVVELGGRHLSLVRQAKDEAFGIAHVEAENTAPEQAVGAVHMREFGERGLRRVLALGQRQRLAAAEAEVPAAVADPGRARAQFLEAARPGEPRSEERRVGQGCVSKCRSRW